jgi:hypothetical protein
LEVVPIELGHLPVVGAPITFKLLGGSMTARVGGGDICCCYLALKISSIIVVGDGIIRMYNPSIKNKK